MQRVDDLPTPLYSYWGEEVVLCIEQIAGHLLSNPEMCMEGGRRESLWPAPVPSITHCIRHCNMPSREKVLSQFLRKHEAGPSRAKA